VSFQVTIPTGQYDSSKLINISAHRWALKPGIGISKTISDYTFEFSADAFILDEIIGSDYCPIAIEINLSNFLKGKSLRIDT